MGGKAFITPSRSDGALDVPRMPPNVYLEVRDKFIAICEDYFARVLTPPEAPGKDDYGDIDILVAEPKDQFNPSSFAQHVGAERFVENGPTSSYAIPYPGEQNKYIQLDIRMCDPADLEWETFMGSYGDLMQILGQLQRDLGLTATNNGLYLRAANPPDIPKKEGMIFLTAEPKRYMRFLELDPDKYDQGFATDEEIFSWCTNSRFFSSGNRGQLRDNTNDRRRKKTRKMFAKFHEYCFLNDPNLNSVSKPWCRQEVAEEAVRFFGVEKQYLEILSIVNEVRKERHLFEKIAINDYIRKKEQERKSSVIRSLRRWIVWRDSRPALRDEPINASHQSSWSRELEVSKFDEGEFIAWICENWQKAISLDHEHV
ncbi:hypothetical protein M501DRAFT_949422, partial [Patellaria atrata CBS 101060]